nr:sugar transferase [endosymbiont of unidentified scaly snail isolate Monju]
MAKRVEYDIEYINSWSLSLDLAIIAQTAFTLFSKNAY